MGTGTYVEQVTASENFTILLKEIRKALTAKQTDGKKYTLSVCLPAKKVDYRPWIEDLIEVGKEAIDYWSVMT